MNERRQSALTNWLASSPVLLVLYATAASFTTYFCMYAFRKPFAAAEYAGLDFLGTKLDLKTAFVISQILGYTLSKYLGIKVISEMTAARRAGALIVFILAAELTLVFFAVLPDQLKIVAIFLNGIPLGMVWGLVVWHLEGRRTSELLLAGLSCSFILSSAFVKDCGRYLLSLGVTEWWMPAATGLCFLPIYLISVWLLGQVPHPDAADVAARTERQTMDGELRVSFMRQFLPGLILLFVAYFFLTAYRDFRDNYMVEIFKELGYEDEPAIFTRAEIFVAFGVTGTLALLYAIRNNVWGLVGAYVIMISGAVLMGVSTILVDLGKLGGFWWMVMVGLGAYLTYVPYGSVLFDRLIASTRATGTAVFAIYVADAIGYTGSVGVQLYRDLAEAELSRLEFFKGFTYFMSACGVVMLVASCAYFLLRHRPRGAHTGSDVDFRRSGG